jgi:hypothetical protein
MAPVFEGLIASIRHARIPVAAKWVFGFLIFLAVCWAGWLVSLKLVTR